MLPNPPRTPSRDVVSNLPAVDQVVWSDLQQAEEIGHFGGDDEVEVVRGAGVKAPSSFRRRPHQASCCGGGRVDQRLCRFFIAFSGNEADLGSVVGQVQVVAFLDQLAREADDGAAPVGP